MRNLTNTQISELYTFVRKDLCYKYNMKIDIEETQIVKGMTGEEVIVDAIKIVYFPKDVATGDVKPGSIDYVQKVRHIEDKISEDIHKFCYENDMSMSLEMGIEKDVWLGEIRYKLVYTTN